MSSSVVMKRVERFADIIGERVEQHGTSRSKIRSLRNYLKKPFKAHLRALEHELDVRGIVFHHPSDLALDRLPIDASVTFSLAACTPTPTVQTDFSGTVVVKKENPEPLYPHQKEAVHELRRAFQSRPNFRGLLVLPTGGGKTYTAVRFLFDQAINQGHKVLWMAHRHELLNQAFRTFEQHATDTVLPHRSSFTYRILSGKHDTPDALRPTDDVVIASKDQMIHHLAVLDEWLSTDPKQRIFCVIDEAHHAPAQTYRRIIDYVCHRYETTLLGLTATPFRTAEDEKGAMRSIFTDDILYSVHLKQLITRGILSDPHFVDVPTYVAFDQALSSQTVHSIQAFDQLPSEIVTALQEHQERNAVIAQHYMDRQDQYGPTLVFALNRLHAISLHAAFSRRGIRSNYVISGERFEPSHEQQEEPIEQFRRGALDVLINVNMLTEGTDLPNVQTVFLTRPTTSKILMTQMIGRALRGKASGGTATAYIVNFTDQWTDQISWENPRHLMIAPPLPTDERTPQQSSRETEWIASRMIQTLAHQLSLGVDGWMHDIPFSQSVPLGVYSFDLLLPTGEGDDATEHCEVLVFEQTAPGYQQLIEKVMPLAEPFREHDPSFEAITQLVHAVESEAFPDQEYLPPPHPKDIRNIVRYVAMTGDAPIFYPFSERASIPIEAVARDILTQDMRRSEENEFLQHVWETSPFLRMYYMYEYHYFIQSVDQEIRKQK